MGCFRFVAVLAGVWLGLFSNALAVEKVELKPVFSELRFEVPLYLTHAGDDSNRLFVVEQTGKIKVFQNSDAVTQAQVFFDINKATKNRFTLSNEEGLLGLAFDPEFKTNQTFYVYYSAVKPRRSVIAKYRVQQGNPNLTDYQSEQVILEVPQDYRNHNGGMLAFGPDGYLYVGLGDGGSAGDPLNRAQDMTQLLGKILRIDGNGNPAPGNPFITNPQVRDEIWAHGLRNPWRFSFDRKTNKLWAADVGQNAWEEVNLIEPGINYGWPWYEATHEFRDVSDAPADLQMPVIEYSHDWGQSITGGYVYRGQGSPALNGWYFFADYVSGRVWAADTAKTPLAPIEVARSTSPSSFGEDQAGELYLVSHTGSIYHVVK
ncbi:PQQ-dependent sugar dehydrogenase [Corallincola platygyrae]|uniref:PQQ-dependent sugar dehydrogenase n=1 Tax=Corallincola platygyrae TaxID=1193278 RepID=A0ABW4XII4_9GAMM